MTQIVSGTVSKIGAFPRNYVILTFKRLTSVPTSWWQNREMNPSLKRQYAEGIFRFL